MMMSFSPLRSLSITRNTCVCFRLEPLGADKAWATQRFVNVKGLIYIFRRQKKTVFFFQKPFKFHILA